MHNKTLTRADIEALEKMQRTRLINCLSGYKSANLIGTRDEQGNENVSVVSSVIHMGSNPPLLGFIVRPRKVERHTLDNILSTGSFTINAIALDFAQQAHQTSARYPKEVSEFNAAGLTPHYEGNISAPFVLESPLKMALELREHIIISSNDTEMVIGEVVHVSLPEQVIMPDGYVDLEALDLVTISGLDSYHVTQRVHRLSYAKPDKALFPLTKEGEPSSWRALVPD
ncbi:flavin reductase family protein [Vibrio sinaloensis]|uniref:flavin reductase family protein n=1 Tax=Photobacterium sp. (strain ATCC 43367) TaxID=379097 RepID=UPI00057E8E72|nr:flavin reductase family protein [Vibrio sinaloensis]KHT51868.1 flavin oxidoreductase [Vibrio sinaloensis]